MRGPAGPGRCGGPRDQAGAGGPPSARSGSPLAHLRPDRSRAPLPRLCRRHDPHDPYLCEVACAISRELNTRTDHGLGDLRTRTGLVVSAADVAGVVIERACRADRGTHWGRGLPEERLGPPPAPRGLGPPRGPRAVPLGLGRSRGPRAAPRASGRPAGGSPSARSGSPLAHLRPDRSRAPLPRLRRRHHPHDPYLCEVACAISRELNTRTGSWPGRSSHGNRPCGICG